MKSLLNLMLLLTASASFGQWKVLGAGGDRVTAFGVHAPYLFFATDAPGIGRYRSDTLVAGANGIDFTQGSITSFAAIGPYVLAGMTRTFGDPGTSWRSSNEGRTWQSSAGGNVCAAGRYVLNAYGTLAGILRSADSGAFKVWETVSTAAATNLAIRGTDIYGWSGSAVWVSRDTGTHWSQLPTPPFLGNVVPMGSLIFINDETGGRIIKSTDQGATWNPVSVDSAGKTVAVRHLRTDGRRLFVGAKNGIFFSLDTGRTWYCGNGNRISTLLDVNNMIVYDTLLVADFARADKLYFTVDARSISEMIAHNGPMSVVPEKENTDFIAIYPNPGRSLLMIETNLAQPIYGVTVLNLLGEEMMTVPSSYGNSLPLDISKLRIGTYFLRIETSKGTTIRKVVRE